MANFLGDFASKIAGGAKGTPDDTLKLAVDGKEYEGWNRVSIKRSLKAISGSFELAVIDRWAEEKTAWPITPGLECKVLIGSETLITGYVDQVSSQFDSNSRGMSVSGRDKTADLVDSSALIPPYNWKLISIFNLAKKIAALFNVKISVDPTAIKAASRPLPGVSLQPGETGFEILDRWAKHAGVLLTSDGAGGIIITRPGKVLAGTRLVQGENILSCEAIFNIKERFSQYIVTSQGRVADDNVPNSDPKVQFQVKGYAEDKGIKRYRPHYLSAESTSTPKLCEQRAQWEAAVRIGKSINVKVSVPGWRRGNGELWEPNQLVTLEAPWAALDVELLITEVTFGKGEDGTITHLQLEPAAAYQPDPTAISKIESFRQAVVFESKPK